MGKATMVTLDTDILKKILKAKKLSASELARRLGYSRTWGAYLLQTGMVKMRSASAIANMLGVSETMLIKQTANEEMPLGNIAESDTAPAEPEADDEAPAPEEPDIMADIEKACRLIISKSIEALEKSAGCIQLEAVAHAVSDVHNILVTHQAKKELRETMNKLLETRKPSECPSFGIGTIPNFKS